MAQALGGRGSGGRHQVLGAGAGLEWRAEGARPRMSGDAVDRSGIELGGAFPRRWWSTEMEGRGPSGRGAGADPGRDGEDPRGGGGPGELDRREPGGWPVSSDSHGSGRCGCAGARPTQRGGRARSLAATPDDQCQNRRPRRAMSVPVGSGPDEPGERRLSGAGLVLVSSGVDRARAELTQAVIAPSGADRRRGGRGDANPWAELGLVRKSRRARPVRSTEAGRRCGWSATGLGGPPGWASKASARKVCSWAAGRTG